MDFNLVILMANGPPTFKSATDNVLKELSNDVQRIIYIVDADQERDYGISSQIKLFNPKAEVIILSDRTQGTACTVLAASAYLEPNVPVIVANCDQYFTIDKTDPDQDSWDEFMEKYDAGMLVFHTLDKDPKWSYAEINVHDWIVRVTKKDPISDMATVGIYYWSRASEMYKSIAAMMVVGDKTNGEYYLCPAFNYTFKRGIIIGSFKAKTMRRRDILED